MTTETRETFDLTWPQHAVAFPDCRQDEEHEHRLPISTFRVRDEARG